jgi:hypothetical protein
LAAKLLGAAASIREATGASPASIEVDEIVEARALARTQLGDGAFAEATAAGAALELDRAVELARAVLLETVTVE